MKKLRSMILCLTLVLTLGLVLHPAPARASGPQDSSPSQSHGGGSPTLGDIIRIIMIVIGH
jgi:hypothetical protein